jgi:hypothetical protein
MSLTTLTPTRTLCDRARIFGSRLPFELRCCQALPLSSHSFWTCLSCASPVCPTRGIDGSEGQLKDRPNSLANSLDSIMTNGWKGAACYIGQPPHVATAAGAGDVPAGAGAGAEAGKEKKGLEVQIWSLVSPREGPFIRNPACLQPIVHSL